MGSPRVASRLAAAADVVRREPSPQRRLDHAAGRTDRIVGRGGTLRPRHGALALARVVHSGGAQLRDGRHAGCGFVRADVARSQQTSPREVVLEDVARVHRVQFPAIFSKPDEREEPQHLAADTPDAGERDAHGSEHVDGVGSEEDPRPFHTRRRDDVRIFPSVSRSPRRDHLGAIVHDPSVVRVMPHERPQRPVRCEGCRDGAHGGDSHLAPARELGDGFVAALG